MGKNRRLRFERQLQGHLVHEGNRVQPILHLESNLREQSVLRARPATIQTSVLFYFLLQNLDSLLCILKLLYDIAVFLA